MKNIFFILFFAVFIGSQGYGQTACDCTGKAEQIVYLIDAIYNSKNPEEKKEFTGKFLKTQDEYVRTVQRALQLNHIKFEIVSSSKEEIEIYGQEWKRFKIAPDDSSKLNRISKRARTDYGIDVIFDPIQLKFASAKGAYDAQKKTLFLSLKSIEVEGSDHTTIHELLHAHFDAAREGRVTFDPKIPVHITFKSEQPITLQGGLVPTYSHFMSFEEMVTYAVNIYERAKEESQSGGSEFELEVQKLIEISNYAGLAAKKGLELLSDERNVLLTRGPRDGFSFIRISKDLSFELKIFVSERQMNHPGFNAANFAKKELERSFQFVQFNFNYFLDPRTGQMKSADSKYAMAFQSAQQSFFQRFESPLNF